MKNAMRNTFTVEEAAEELGVNPETIRRAIRSGRLPSRRDKLHAGGPYIIRGEDLDAFVERMTS
jgi:excisionase family DNA binding protein